MLTSLDLLNTFVYGPPVQAVVYLSYSAPRSVSTTARPLLLFDVLIPAGSDLFGDGLNGNIRQH